MLLARVKHSIWTFLQVEYTGSLSEFHRNWTVSGTELWCLLGDNNLGKNKLPKQTEMLDLSSH